MSGADISAEVAQALAEASAETGSGSPLVATLRRTTGGAATPWASGAGTVEDYSAYAVVSFYNARLIDGENIRASDRRVMAWVSGITPTTADRLIIGALDMAIISVQTIAPGGVPLYHVLQCRA